MPINFVKLRYRLRSNSRRQSISPVAVPFVLPRHVIPDGRIVLSETWSSSGPAIVIGAFLLVLAAASGIALATGLLKGAPVDLLWKCATFTVLGTLLGGALFVLGFVTKSSTKWTIRPDHTGSRIELVDSNDRDEIVMLDVPASSASLRVDTVTVTQKAVGRWEGFALMPQLDKEAAIAIACLPERDRIETWLESAPVWLQRLPLTAGDQRRALGRIQRPIRSN